uniref:Uncharacterized protein n=1 Tax=Tetranychus urticae TaxID=32264 RepID=T1L021_TETUR
MVVMVTWNQRNLGRLLHPSRSNSERIVNATQVKKREINEKYPNN